MKIKTITIVALVIFAMYSCKKESTAPSTPTYQIEGLWIGNYTVDNNPDEAGIYYYSCAVYPDGSMLTNSLGADGNPYYSTGTWSLSGSNVFTATITTLIHDGPQVTQKITANFSNTGKMTEGVWVDITNSSQSGKLSLERVK